MSHSLRRFSRESLPITPWKNGGGSTREILSWPPGAGVEGFDWRVSIAIIGASGPFSIFDRVDRVILLLEGDGVRLQAADDRIDRRLDRPHAPFAFRGESKIDCTLLGGPSIDFNVMSRRAAGRSEVHLIDAADSAPLPPAHGGLLMGLAGRWQAGDEVLDVGDGLWWADANLPRAWPRTRPIESHQNVAKLVAVRWTPAAAAG